MNDKNELSCMPSIHAHISRPNMCEYHIFHSFLCVVGVSEQEHHVRSSQAAEYPVVLEDEQYDHWRGMEEA